MATTKQATGLSITRDKSVFTFSWNVGDDNYDDGVRVAYRFKVKNLTANAKTNKNEWVSSNTDWKFYPSNSTWYGDGRTSFRVSVDFKEFYPYKEKRLLYGVEFGVIGRRSGYTASAWAYKTFDVNDPYKPSVAHELDDTAWDTARYAWSTPTSDNNSRVFSNVQWQTLCLKDSGTASKNVKFTKANARKNGYGWDEGSSPASYSKQIQENSAVLFVDPNNKSSYTRYFRCRARGPAGNSDWVYTKHVYARPHKPTSVKTKWSKNGNTGYIATISWAEKNTSTHPVDYMTVQYAIVTPGAGLSFPGEGSWTDAYTIKDSKDADRVTFNVDNTLADNQCMFARVVAHHDHNDTASNATVFKKLGRLAKPAMSVSSITTSSAMFNVTNNATDVPDSFVAIYYREQKAVEPTSKKYQKSGEWVEIGTIRSGSTGLTFPQVEDTSKIGFSAIAYSYDSTDSSKRKRVLGSKREVVSSNLPLAPTITSLVSGDDSESAIITWEWSWSSATAAEVSWSDDQDAWESTEEPESYTVENQNQTRLIVRGLEPGKPWYFRVRLIMEDGDISVNTPWSDIDDTSTIELMTDPYRPSFSIYPDVVKPDEDFTMYWSYYTDDEKEQASVQFQYATSEEEDERNEPWNIDTNEGGYKELEKVETTVQSVSRNLEAYSQYETHMVYVQAGPTYIEGNTYYYLDYEDLQYHLVPNPSDPDNPYKNNWFIGYLAGDGVFKNWFVGNKYFVRCRVYSETGRFSEWSEWIPVTIVEPPVAAIEIVSTTALTSETTTETVDVREDMTESESITTTTYKLTDLPIVIRVTGAGEGGETAVYIERAQDFNLKRPDETTFTGREGEAVCILHRDSSEEEYVEFTINRSDVPGDLDDGATYKLTAIVKDSNGLTDSTSIDNILVSWSHQAIVPTATSVLDSAAQIMKITVDKPVGALDSDGFDLYRLTADKPELIIQNGSLNTVYVDPYPAMGRHCGHRVVYKTANGDYTTTNNTIAWVDLTPDNDGNEFTNWIQSPTFDAFMIVIDFDGKHVELPYNIDLSNSWAKEFTETKYLGGSVIGDWNPAVSRTSSLNTTVMVDDWDTILLLRQLASYSGVCHVRMPDGSSFSADVQVSESREERWVSKLSSFALEVTRVDSQALDGLTYESWISNTQE